MTNPYRDNPPGPTRDPAYLPRPWWRRMLCLIGLHAWVALDALGRVGMRPSGWHPQDGEHIPFVSYTDPFADEALSDYYPQGARWSLCGRCGAVGRGTVS